MIKLLHVHVYIIYLSYFTHTHTHTHTHILSLSLSLSLPVALGSPTSIDFLHGESIVVSYSTAKVVVYDVETGKAVVTLDSALTYSKRIHLITAC